MAIDDSVQNLRSHATQDHADDGGEVDMSALLTPLKREWRRLLAAFVAAGLAGAAGSFLITPMFTSATTFLPPQQQQNNALSTLASLGTLAGLGVGGIKSSADQYASLMQSVTVADRIIDRFHLMGVYDEKLRVDARKELGRHTLITLGKKDGLITVAVDDRDPRRAADMANQYVEELRRVTSTLAVSEAQQRRVFFEKQMEDTKARLITAQTALQGSGFTPGALKAEPRATAEQYAQLRAQATAADIKLQTLRNSLAEAAPEVQQQSVLLQALRSKLGQFEATTQGDQSASDYVSKYREFKYQETLFDLMAKQYELARVDEAREGALIQVVDPALPAERKSKPKRTLIAAGAAIAGVLLFAAWLVLRDRRRANESV